MNEIRRGYRRKGKDAENSKRKYGGEKEKEKRKEEE
jgi:hypothetical protein